MTTLSPELRALIEAGPLAHLSTINPDGSPQVTVVWIGLEGDEIVSGHTRHYRKLRNIERDGRVVLSFTAPRDHDAFLNPYAVLNATATVERSDDVSALLSRLAKVYMRPESVFPGSAGAGYIVRYRVDRVGGDGPWATP